MPAIGNVVFSEFPAMVGDDTGYKFKICWVFYKKLHS